MLRGEYYARINGAYNKDEIEKETELIKKGKSTGRGRMPRSVRQSHAHAKPVKKIASAASAIVIEDIIQEKIDHAENERSSRPQRRHDNDIALAIDEAAGDGQIAFSFEDKEALTSQMPEETDGNVMTDQQGRTGKLPMGKYVIYTDGGCKPNPGVGGFGVVILKDGKEVERLSEGYMYTTNNRMEVMAVIKGLERIESGSEIDVYMDSEYVRKTMLGEYAKKKNVDMWERLDRAAAMHKRINPMHVPAHTGIMFNEECDNLATDGRNNPTQKDAVYEAEMNPQKQKAGSQGTSILGCRKEELPEQILKSRILNPNRSKVNELCVNDIQAFYTLEKHVFRDYIGLKSYGVDGYSSLSYEALKREICDDEVVSVIDKAIIVFSYKTSALKWYLRGLSVLDCIQKVSVDAQLASYKK